MAKAKRGFMDGYKTYDDSAGRGSAREWRGAFNERMGYDEAKAFFDEQPASKRRMPRTILGVSLSAAWGEIKSAYRKLMRTHAADAAEGRLQAARVAQNLPMYTAEELVPLLAEQTEQLKEINAAYSILAYEFKK
jgi:DnaJ-class molecular chaperone